MVSEGDRVKLVSTDDPYTTTSVGCKGTVEGIDTIPANATPMSSPQKQIWVKWDDGSKWALLEGTDSYEVID